MGADTALENPVWSSLVGPHAHVALTRGQAGRYPPDMAPFVALAPGHDRHAWDDLAALGDGHRMVLLGGLGSPPPESWEVVGQSGGVQMVDVGLRAEDDPEAVRLDAFDVPEMLDLVRRTRPGPLRPRAVELGIYLGIRRDGALVAMAGERFHLPGWREISAVCTDPGHRGRGLGTRLVRAVAAGIRARGETPFLHTAASNAGAIRLYESLGFALSRTLTIYVVRPNPAAAVPQTSTRTP